MPYSFKYPCTFPTPVLPFLSYSCWFICPQALISSPSINSYVRMDQEVVRKRGKCLEKLLRMYIPFVFHLVSFMIMLLASFHFLLLLMASMNEIHVCREMHNLWVFTYSWFAHYTRITLTTNIKQTHMLLNTISPQLLSMKSNVTFIYTYCTSLHCNK